MPEPSLLPAPVDEMRMIVVRRASPEPIPELGRTLVRGEALELAASVARRCVRNGYAAFDVVSAIDERREALLQFLHAANPNVVGADALVDRLLFAFDHLSDAAAYVPRSSGVTDVAPDEAA